MSLISLSYHPIYLIPNNFINVIQGYLLRYFRCWLRLSSAALYQSDHSSFSSPLPLFTTAAAAVLLLVSASTLFSSPPLFLLFPFSFLCSTRLCDWTLMRFHWTKASPDAFSCTSWSRDFVGSSQIVESSITGAAPSGLWDKVEMVFQMVSSLAWQLTRVHSPNEHKALIYSATCGYIDEIYLYQVLLCLLCSLLIREIRESSRLTRCTCSFSGWEEQAIPDLPHKACL